jgi:hypothetical protein
MSNQLVPPTPPSLFRSPSVLPRKLAYPKPPVTLPEISQLETQFNDEEMTESSIIDQEKKLLLELKDGTSFEGYSFGYEGESVSGELVFQTGEFPRDQGSD